ncbi:MAG: hypothetical protein QM680_01145 [Luteolibacter sp.]
MTEQPPQLPAKSSSCLIKIAIAAAVVLLVLGGLWWWFNRPIQPVVLSAQEKSVVEAKVEAIQKPAEPTYEKGTKDIILTERELNGLLNENTDLGKSVSLQLGTDVIIARVETDLDPDMPVVGGKRLKARARFFVSQKTGVPSLVLDDVTVWGVSLPNDWLAGVKGRDLLSETLGKNGKIAGIEEFKIEPGQLRIRLGE